ncbi:MAG: molybdopterin-dependent oxidoreductase, partial [Pseudomonadota bacterium]
MPIHKKKDWSIPEKDATDEHVYLNRRRILTAMGIGGAILAAPLAFRAIEKMVPEPKPVAPPEPDPSAGLYPVERNAAFVLDRPVSPEDDVLSYNNFYEFGSHKSIASAAQALRIRPWQVRLDGLVERETTVDIDDLLQAMPLEERLYRHRCVEAWAMAVPWSGFPLRALV